MTRWFSPEGHHFSSLNKLMNISSPQKTNQNHQNKTDQTKLQSSQHIFTYLLI